MELGRQLNETVAASIQRDLVPLKISFGAWKLLQEATDGAKVPARAQS